MRTKYGEITFIKIIIAIFIFGFWILTLSSIISDIEGFSFSLDIKYYLIAFFIYIFLFFFGFAMNMWDAITKLNLPGFGYSKDHDKNILELKKNGFFIYGGGDNFNAIKDETRHINTNQVTAFDRFLYEHGPPFGDAWEFMTGVVFWFGMLPLMASAFLTVFLILPLVIIFMLYNFFF